MILKEIARSLAVASVLAFGTVSTAAVASSQPAVVAEATNSYFVVFEESGALHYQGGLPNLPRTASEAEGVPFDSTRPEVAVYRAHLADVREAYISQITSVLGRSVEVDYHYDILFNGVSIANLTGSEAARLVAQPGVKEVTVVEQYELSTDRVSEFIGAGTIWDGTSTPDGAGFRGEGTVVAVIDTGINSAFASHPFFSDDASCGFNSDNVKVIAKDCLGSSDCTGANPFSASNPHGSHVASTAAGNDHVATGGDLSGTRVSGVAPCAGIVSYKACATNNCDGAALAAARQTILVDQVPLGITSVNYSISGGNNPWSTTDSDRAFLDMVNAGLFVAASAGNTSTAVPNPIGTVAHRGPWVATVANSTHDRVSSNDVNLDQGGPQNVYGVKGGMPIPSDQVGQVGDGLALGNDLGCSGTGGFAPGSLTGRIVLVTRGECNFSEKLANAQGAGAIAGIVINSNPGQPPIVMGATETSIPAVMVSYADGQAIRAHVAANPSSLATISAAIVTGADPGAGDILSAGSLRGPIPGGLEFTKPDITGPGTNIFAAYDAGASSYGFMSGTSMSGPHVAGAGALIAGLKPDWTPPEVKSALMLTAKKEGWKDFVNGTPNNTQWDADDVGNGRLDLTKAALSGLVLHETYANFLAAQGNQANQRALNLASARHTDCSPNCTWTRTVRSTLAQSADWTVSVTQPEGFTVSVTPTTFTLGAGAEQTLTITASPNVGETGEILRFGYVDLTSPSSPDLHLSLAVRGIGGAAVGDIDLALSLFATPNPVDNGEQLTYIASVANFGPDPATGVAFELELPAGNTFISASELPDSTLLPVVHFENGGDKSPARGAGGFWNCAASGTSVICELVGTITGSSLAPTISILTAVNVPEPGIVTATGTVSADQSDINPGNESVEIEIEVTGLSDIIFQDGFGDVPIIVGRNCIDIDGSTSNGAFNSGDPNNRVWLFDIGAGNAVTAIELTATIEAYSPSWITEARIGLAAQGAAAPTANIGVAISEPGVVDASGVVPLDSPVVVGSDGLLRVERNETYNDPEIDPDSIWTRWENPDFECAGLHLVCTDQDACDAGVANPLN